VRLDAHQTILHDQNSWGRALNIIDARIRLHLDTENGSLRDWRGVIKKAHTDFQANFLGSGHNSFASLVYTMDGREEGSEFPNLMLPIEKDRHGV
jgi:hypothetical protein